MTQGHHPLRNRDGLSRRTDWNENLGLIFLVVVFILFKFLKKSFQRSVIVNIDGDVS